MIDLAGQPTLAILPRAGERAVGAWGLLLWSACLAAVFLAVDVDWEVSTYELYARDPEEAGAQVEAGSVNRKAAYLFLAVLGFGLLAAPRRQRLDLGSFAGLMLALYLMVCGTSFAWSDAPALTVKRFVVTICCTLAVLGLARQFSVGSIRRLAIGIGLLLVACGVIVELKLGTWRPWSAAYRFAGTAHPNVQGSYCALLVLATFFGWRRCPDWWFPTLVLLATSATLLLLTKSRSAISGCLIGAVLGVYLTSDRHARRTIGLLMPLLAALVALGMVMAGWELFAGFDTAIQLGRTEEAGLGSLNGRWPLWCSLWKHLWESPLLGHGYHGFWTAGRVYNVSLDQDWTVPHAHSVYLDSLLGVGLLGTIPLALLVVSGIWRAAQRCRQTRDTDDAFVVAVAAYGVVAGILESGFAQPTSFDSFIAAAALACVIFQTRRRMCAVGDRPAVWQPPVLRGAPHQRSGAL